MPQLDVKAKGHVVVPLVTGDALVGERSGAVVGVHQERPIGKVHWVVAQTAVRLELYLHGHDPFARDLKRVSGVKIAPKWSVFGRLDPFGSV